MTEPITEYKGRKEMTPKKIEWFNEDWYKVWLPPDFNRFDYYPHVTKVLGIIDKPWLRRWYGDLGTELAIHRSKQAMARGSRIHDLIHATLQFSETGEGQPISMLQTQTEQDEWLQVVHFQDFYESVKPVVLGSEMEVVCHSLRYAGTLDLLAFIKAGTYDLGYAKPETLKEGVYVVDVKTGNMDDAYHYQTASYANAVQEMELGRVLGTIILLTDSNTKKGWKAIVHSEEQVEFDLKCFKAAKILWDAKDVTVPKSFEIPETIQLTKYQ